MNNFRVGQKVVCIQNGAVFNPGEQDVVVGQVYTVRGFGHYKERVGLYLEEIVNPPVQTFVGIMERSYSVTQFRPAVERKTDISVFTKILDEVRSKEPV